MNYKGTEAQEREIAAAESILEQFQSHVVDAQQRLEDAYIARLPVKVGDIVRPSRNPGLEAKVVGFHSAKYGWLRVVYRKKDKAWSSAPHVLFDWTLP